MALLTPATISELLDRHDLRPSRALGQHFLADPNTARRIVRLAAVEPDDHVLEIGPGVGSLTVALAEVGASVTALELDRHLLAALEDVVGGLPNVRVVQGDALTADLAALLPEQSASWKLVANLPYNLATPMVARVLEEAPTVSSLLVMVQREVGERLAASSGGKEYGAISVKVAYYGRAKVVGVVPRTVFIPMPNVDSVLIRIDRHATPPVDVPSADALFALVRAGFSQRRKMLRRSLQSQLAERTNAVLELAGIDPQARAESLDLEAWAALAGPPRDPRLPGVGEAHPVVGGARCARRRLPRDRSADGVGRRPVRRTVVAGRRVRSQPRSHRTGRDRCPVRRSQPRRAHGTRGARRRSRPRHRAVQAHSSRLRSRRRIVRRGGRPALLRGHVPARPGGRGRGGGRDRFRHPVLPPGRPRVDARARRGHRTGVAARVGARPHRGPAVRHLDRVRVPRVGRAGGPRHERSLAPPVALGHLVDELVNDLEPAAEHVEPKLAPFRDALETAAGAPALLAGSGSACWIPFEDPDAWRAAATRVEASLGLPAHLGTVLTAGAAG